MAPAPAVSKPTAPATPHSSLRTPPSSRIAGSVFVNISAIPRPAVVAAAPAEAKPIDQQLLEQYWAQAMGHFESVWPKTVAAVRSRKLRLEDSDSFVVEVPNSFITAELKPHLMELLEYLRPLAGRPALNCRCEVVYDEVQEAVVYSARDKYSVMSQANPMLATFKVLFPEVDL